MAPAGNMSVPMLMTSCGLSGEDPGLWPPLFLEPLLELLLASPFPGGVPSPGAILIGFGWKFDPVPEGERRVSGHRDKAEVRRAALARCDSSFVGCSSVEGWKLHVIVVSHGTLSQMNSRP